MSKTIESRLAAVSAAITSVPKNARNKFAGYDYASVDDIYASVRKKMAANEVTLDLDIDYAAMQDVTVKTRKGAQIFLSVPARVRFCCPEGAEEWQGRFILVPTSSGPQAAGAAESYLTKSALRQKFLIPTGEVDLDHDEHAPQEPARDQPPELEKPTVRPPSRPNDNPFLNKKIVDKIAKEETVEDQVKGYCARVAKFDRSRAKVLWRSFKEMASLSDQLRHSSYCERAAVTLEQGGDPE